MGASLFFYHLGVVAKIKEWIEIAKNLNYNIVLSSIVTTTASFVKVCVVTVILTVINKYDKN